MHDALSVNVFTSYNIMFTLKGKRKKCILASVATNSNKSFTYNTIRF